MSGTPTNIIVNIEDVGTVQQSELQDNRPRSPFVIDTMPDVGPVSAPTTSEEAQEEKPIPPENTLIPGRHFGFKDVDDIIQDTYNLPESSFSTICDIMAMYLAGQKILYTEAKTYCELRLNYLMLPAIAITALCTILSLVLKDYSFGATIVSCLNGVNAFILALINYLKLDAKAEAHRTSAYKFDKLQANLVFNSGKILFIEDAKKELGKIIGDTENNVREIKETNQFILPEAVRFNYPNLYSMNVFVEVKKIQNREMELINELKDIFNDIYDIKQAQQHLLKESKEVPEVVSEKLQVYENDYKDRMGKILRLKNKYLEIDSAFEREMKEHRYRVRRGIQCCGWLKT